MKELEVSNTFVTQMKDIKNILSLCISILKTIRIDYNSPIGPRTRSLISEIKKLIPLLEKEQPHIANILRVSSGNLMSNGYFINAYAFGDIRTAISILNNIYNNEESKNSLASTENVTQKDRKKIFISHSSKDKHVVEKFVDHILMLGIGFSAEDIFCTSIEDMAIKNGEDIRCHIHTNIKDVDFSILLISQHYKKSEICINEMGAVWAYNNNVRLYLLPDVDFCEIGWLCDTRKADKLFDSIALDALKMELSTLYSLEDKGKTWSRQRELFLSCNNISKQ